MAPQYRHEWKHVLNIGDLLILRQRLRAIMESDPHAIDGKYQIRSLYFDNLDDKALREKIDGVNMREKFRRSGLDAWLCPSARSGIVLQDAVSGNAPEDTCGLHQGAVHLPAGKRAGYPGL